MVANKALSRDIINRRSSGAARPWKCKPFVDDTDRPFYFVPIITEYHLGKKARQK
jgi:hypothetical protein